MTSLVAITHEGAELKLDAQAGLSVMEALREGNVDELLALCGGCCSCATCHVYVDERFSALMPAMSADESDLLELSGHRRANSRLSCQIAFTPALDGLRVTIAPED